MTITHNLYAVYDRKAQYYLPPFACRSDADAERQFTEAVMTSETPISQYPAEFDLVRLGSIDLETGFLSSNQGGMPYLMLNGLVCLEAAHQTRNRYRRVLEQPNSDESHPDAS